MKSTVPQGKECRIRGTSTNPIDPLTKDTLIEEGALSHAMLAGRSSLRIGMPRNAALVRPSPGPVAPPCMDPLRALDFTGGSGSRSCSTQNGAHSWPRSGEGNSLRMMATTVEESGLSMKPGIKHSSPSGQMIRVGRFGAALRRESLVRSRSAAHVVPALTTWTPTSSFSSSSCGQPDLRTGEAPEVTPRPPADTRKMRRESENAIAPGGMRTPWRYVASRPKARQIGMKLAATIDTFVLEHPHLIAQLIDEGASGRKKFKESGEEDALAARIAKLLGTDDISRGPRSRWRAGIVEAYVAKAEDPDHVLASWLKHGAPTGVMKDIQACGVFPAVDNAAESQSELQKFFAKSCNRRNYKSAEDNAALVSVELQRLRTEGYLIFFGSWAEVKAALGDFIINRIAAIIKTKADGTLKVRIIVDMLRSHVNEFVKVHERVVLPRLMDVIADVVDLATPEPTESTSRTWEEWLEDYVDIMVLDWADAFHSMGVDIAEIPTQVFRVPGTDEFAAYDTVVFGGGGAGYVWCRGGAFLGRSGQSMFAQVEARIEVYVDDPLTTWRGTLSRIRDMKTRLLLWWIIVGPEISWSKVQHGTTVKWIGVTIQIVGRLTISLKLPEEYAMELVVEANECLELKAIPVVRVQSLAGRSAWVAGFIPAVSSMIAPLWAAIADCKSRKLAQPRTTLVPAVRVRHALRWIVAFASGRRGVLEREFNVSRHKQRGRLSIEFDASPWGYGGVLFWCGQPWAYFAEKISVEDIARFSLEVGSCTHQALLETLAILIGIRLWLPLWKDERLTVRIRSDSSAALRAVEREKSSNPKLNEVVRELALDLAEGLYKIDVKEHLTGKDNSWGDSLSRLWQPGSNAVVPNALVPVERTIAPIRDKHWWRAGGDPLEAFD